MALTGPSSEWAYAFGVDLPAGTKRGADIHLVSGLRLDKLHRACRRFYVGASKDLSQYERPLGRLGSVRQENLRHSVAVQVQGCLSTRLLNKSYQIMWKKLERVEYNSLGIFAGDGRASIYAPKIPTVRIKAEQWSGGWHEIIKSGSGALSESECDFQPPLNY